MDATKEESEFGSGLVVCLVKFSEHLHNEQAQRIWAMIGWNKGTAVEHTRLEEEAKTHPVGDAARRLARVKAGFYMPFSMPEQTPEAQISHAIELWMNGASDHFYGLAREHAPEPLVNLADLVLKIGHGFTGERWTEATLDEINKLWKESTLALEDKVARLVGAVSETGYEFDWGQW